MYRVMVENRCFQEYSKLNEAKEMASIIEPVEKMRGNEVYIAHKNGKKVEV